MTFKYEGELTKPIPAPTIGLLMEDGEIEKIASAITTERNRRMALIFDAHGIQHGNWIALCFALANAHVPGFRVANKKAGRPKKWDELTRAELVLAVEETGINNITEATAHLATTEPWRSRLAATRGAETLRDEYARADNRWVNVLRHARAYEKLPKDIKAKLRENI